MRASVLLALLSSLLLALTAVHASPLPNAKPDDDSATGPGTSQSGDDCDDQTRPSNGVENVDSSSVSKRSTSRGGGGGGGCVAHGYYISHGHSHGHASASHMCSSNGYSLASVTDTTVISINIAIIICLGTFQDAWVASWYGNSFSNSCPYIESSSSIGDKHPTGGSTSCNHNYPVVCKM
ncbi:hypothetical protein RI367_004892 [Sorochytrium milnesiophthora]